MTAPADNSSALALLASLDGHVLVRTCVEGDDPGAVGRQASDELRRAFPEEIAS